MRFPVAGRRSAPSWPGPAARSSSCSLSSSPPWRTSGTASSRAGSSSATSSWPGRSWPRGKYKLAEESFARAFEQSESKRLDIDEERLEAKVQAVNADPDWGVDNPEGLEEADFLYLLQLQREPGQSAKRAATLTCYGTFLASEKRWREAEEKLQDAARLDPRDAGPLVNLGNLLRDRGRLVEAEAAYRRALALEIRDGRIHYDLGLVLEETGHPAEALEQFKKAVACDPRDLELQRALASRLERSGREEEARKVFGQILVLDPSDAEALKRIPKRDERAAKGKTGP